MKTIETPKPTIKESEKLDEHIRSLLVIYEAILHRTMLDISSSLVQAREISSTIAISAIAHGAKKGEVEFIWSDDSDSASPKISLVETGKKYIQVVVPDSHLKELEKEIAKVAPDCNLPYFFMQTDYIAGIIKKLGWQKRGSFPIRKLIEATVSKIYELHLEISSSSQANNFSVAL